MTVVFSTIQLEITFIWEHIPFVNKLLSCSISHELITCQTIFIYAKVISHPWFKTVSQYSTPVVKSTRKTRRGTKPEEMFSDKFALL